MLKFTKITVSEVHHCSTVGANQMMMMFHRSPQQITTATTLSMHLTDKSKLSEYIECTVDSDPTDAVMSLMYLFIYRCWCKMLIAESDGIYYLAPLWGELIPSPPQQCYYLVFS
jgi:hypothetical protein